MWEAESRPLRIMTFNLWRGGIQVDFGQVAAAIRAADPDIVGLQEPEGNTRRLAALLDWPFADEGLHLISRHPIFRLPVTAQRTDIARFGGQSVALIEVQPGAVVAVVNLHLASSPYGPTEITAGRSDAEVTAIEERARLAEIRPHIDRLKELATRGIPVFLIGDFNAPSHLDWIETAMRQRPEVVRPFRWPVSAMLEAAGFRDSFREAHPDPVAHPGITWSPGCPHPKPYPDLIPDRIDFIMAAGPSRTLGSQVVGETGGPGVDIGLRPWPSDHRAMLSSFEAQPRFPGEAVTLERTVLRQGEPVVIRYLVDPGDPKSRIGIADPDGRLITTMAIGDGSDRRAFAFGTATLAPGNYDAVLVGGDGTIRAARRFWVLDRDAVPEIAVVSPDIAPGAPMVARWRNAPANRYDWAGVYRRGETDPENYLAHAYTGARAFGEIAFEPGDFAERLIAGDYELRLIRDDAYVTLAVTSFRIVPG